MRPQLCIRRLSATYRLSPDEVDVAARLDGVLDRVAHAELGHAVRQSQLGSGEWCVRRLDVTIPIRLTDTDASMARQWSASLVAAMRQMISDGSPNIVHYPRSRDALVELVSEVACGRSDRAWAWEQIGVRRPGDPAPGDEPVETILVALCRSPHEALPVIATVCRRIGLAALDRTLGPDGWVAVIEIVVGAARGSVPARRDASEAMRFATPELEMVLDRVPRESNRHRVGASDASRRVALAVMSSSTIFDHVRRTRLRADPIRAWAWAVLSTVEADPSITRRDDRDDIVAVVVSSIVGGNQPASSPTTRPSTSTLGRALDTKPDLGTKRDLGTESGDAADSADAARFNQGDDPDRDSLEVEGRQEDHGLVGGAASSTRWAGLLFLLNVATDTDLIDGIVDAAMFTNRTLRWVLHALARELVPVAATDPVALAFAGLEPSAAPPSMNLLPPTADETDRLGELAARWAEALVNRLRRDGVDDGRTIVEEVAARYGEIVAEPGWIDVHLRLEDIDLDVRLAGLDFDPGWIPWLGCVLRFVYDR